MLARARVAEPGAPDTCINYQGLSGLLIGKTKNDRSNDEAREYRQVGRLSPMDGGISGYLMLAREIWRRRKGAFGRRLVLVIAVAIYTLGCGRILSNTSCSPLIGSGCAATSSIPT
jgi:hypothetical protein